MPDPLLSRPRHPDGTFAERFHDFVTPTALTEADAYVRLRSLIDRSDRHRHHAPPDAGLRDTLTALVPDSCDFHPAGGPLQRPLYGIDPLTALPPAPLSQRRSCT
jgi:hypothetical protein